MNPLDIRALRLGLKYTQARLGLWVGVHASSVGRWERGQHRPRPRHIDRLHELQHQAHSDPIGAATTDPAAHRREAALDRSPAKRNAVKRSPTKHRTAKRSTAQQIATIRAALSTRAMSASTVEYGDRWELHHGDLFDVVPTLPPAHFDALIVDLPYSSGGLHIGTRQQSTQRKYQGSRVQNRRQDFDGDQRDQLSFRTWATDVLRLSYRTLKRSAVFATFIDWRQLAPMILAVQCAGFTLRGIAVWDKSEAARPTPGRFRAQCEYILWGSKGELPGARGVPVLPGVLRSVVRARDKHHLTGKPTAVMRWLAQFVTPGGTILDPCAGSGTTGVGALLEGRAFVGVEQDGHYARVAAARLRAAEQGRVMEAGGRRGSSAGPMEGLQGEAAGGGQ